MLAAEGIESDDATKENGQVVVAFCWNRPFVSQLVGNRWWQNRIEQSERNERNKKFEQKCSYVVTMLYYVVQQRAGLELPD